MRQDGFQNSNPLRGLRAARDRIFPAQAGGQGRGSWRCTNKTTRTLAFQDLFSPYHFTGSQYPVEAPEKIQKEMNGLFAWVQRERDGYHPFVFSTPLIGWRLGKNYTITQKSGVSVIVFEFCVKV